VIAAEVRSAATNLNGPLRFNSYAVFQLRLACRARAMDATEDLSIGFHAVSHDPAVAMGAHRRQCMDRTFEAIERVTLSGNNHLERFVIFILANFACSHTTILSQEAPSSVVLFSASNAV
jgi:hypothetical protein